MTQFLLLSKRNRTAINYRQVIDCLYISLKLKHSVKTFIREIIKSSPSLTNAGVSMAKTTKFYYKINIFSCIWHDASKSPKTLKTLFGFPKKDNKLSYTTFSLYRIVISGFILNLIGFEAENFSGFAFVGI